jgi:hypothetical protein
MRIAPVRAHFVATDAVRCRALIVTARAQQDITARGSTVKAARTRIAANPAGRMRIAPFGQTSAHAASQMTRVASIRRVAPQAARRLRLRLHGVRSHEVAPVHEVSLHGFRLAALHAQILRRVVAAFAIGLRVTSLAELLLLYGVGSVVLHEVAFVSQERLRQHAPDLGQRVTRCTLPAVPLLFVLMTAETLVHGRQARSARFHDARVTRHALSKGAFQRQMSIVIEGDAAVRMLDWCRYFRSQTTRIAMVTARTSTDRRQAGRGAARRRRMAARARQARRFAGNTAGDTGQVQLVWETSLRVIAASNGERRHQHEQRTPAVLETRASTHGAPRTVAKSKS